VTSHYEKVWLRGQVRYYISLLNESMDIVYIGWFRKKTLWHYNLSWRGPFLRDEHSTWRSLGKITEGTWNGWVEDPLRGLCFSHLLLLRCDIFLLTSRFFEWSDHKDDFESWINQWFCGQVTQVFGHHSKVNELMFSKNAEDQKRFLFWVERKAPLWGTMKTHRPITWCVWMLVDFTALSCTSY